MQNPNVQREIKDMLYSQIGIINAIKNVCATQSSLQVHCNFYQTNNVTIQKTC